jgi:hypothetical protein
MLALCLSSAACAPLLDGPKPLDFRPAANASAEVVNTDEMDYQGAATAIDARDYALALDFLQTARQKQPGDIRVLNAFGVVYDKLGRFDLSARYYAQAKAIDPDSPVVQKNIAYSQVLQGLTRVAGHTSPGDAAHASASTSVAVALPKASLPDSTKQVAADTPAPRSLTTTTQSRAVSAPAVPFTLAQNVSREALKPIAAVAESSSSVAPTSPAQLASDDQRPVLPTPGSMAAPAVNNTLRHAHISVPLLTRHPLVIVNASGRKDATATMRRHLASLGWTIPLSASRDAGVRRYSMLYFAEPHIRTARALARTVRFNIRLAARACGCGGLELVVGEDLLPLFARARDAEIGDEGFVNGLPLMIPTKAEAHVHGPAKS